MGPVRGRTRPDPGGSVTERERGPQHVDLAAVGVLDPAGQVEVLHLGVTEDLVDREDRAARHRLGQHLDPLGRRARPEQTTDLGIELGPVRDA